MATGTVKELEEERKREEGRRLRRELLSAMAKCARFELEQSGTGSSDAALLDQRLRSDWQELTRQALELAYGKDDTAPGPCPDCGGRTRLLRVEKARVETVLGSVRVEMARRTCRECGRSSRPRARRLDFEGSMTPSARRLASVAGSQASYAQADGLVRELAGLNFGVKRIERATRAVGDDLEAWREKADADGDGAKTDAAAGPSLAREASKPGRKLCCAVDGTGVPARPSETAGRAGKDGGRAGTREAKVGALWVSGDGRARPGRAWWRARRCCSPASRARRRRPARSRRSSGGCCANWRRRAARRRNVEVCVGDGAEWIRRVFDDWFPDAVRIVDYYHATEYLWEAARARLDGDLAKTWAKRLCAMLRAGRLDDVLDSLRERGGDVEECRKAVAYLDARRDRMRYDECLAEGLPIGSGIIEAGCKNVVGQRMKCTGMRWTVVGANPVLWLRCARLGGWFDDYWDARIARLAA